MKNTVSKNPMRAISLGWGIQSFTLSAMAALGEIEAVSVAIHADTTHERQATYEFAARWTPWLEKRGVSVITVTDNTESVRIGVADEHGGVFIPAFTHNGKTRGQLRRQCTQKWKIAPMRRWLHANRNGAPIDLLLGISLDEALRMKPSNVKYIRNKWPLIDMGMTREDCVRWLQNRGLEIPVKSACTFCPYHDQQSWREIKNENGADWKEANRIDIAIRNKRPPHNLYIHQARVPIEEIDFRTMQERGQLSLWNDECSGICGV